MKIAAIASETSEYFPKAEPETVDHRSKLELLARNTMYAVTPTAEKEQNSDGSEDISLQTVQHATEAIEAYMASSGVNLKFSVDDRTDTVQVEVRNPDTNKLIRKIPSDEMLDLAASIEKMVGFFLDKTL